MLLAGWLVFHVFGVKGVRNWFPINHRTPAVPPVALSVKIFAGFCTRRDVLFIPFLGFRSGNLTGTLFGMLYFDKRGAIDFVAFLSGILEFVSKLVDAPNFAIAPLDSSEPFLFTLGLLACWLANLISERRGKAKSGGLGEAMEAVGYQLDSVMSWLGGVNAHGHLTRARTNRQI